MRARFVAKMVEVLPDHLSHVFLSNSGAEAIDGAIKYARLATGRTGIVATMRSFHGRTIGALSLTWEPKYRKPFAPLLDVTHALQQRGATRRRGGREHGYGDVEPVQGEAASTWAAAFMQAAAHLANAPLVVTDPDQLRADGRGHEHFGRRTSSV